MPLFFERANNFVLKFRDPYGLNEDPDLTNRGTDSASAPANPATDDLSVSGAAINVTPSSLLTSTSQGGSDSLSDPRTSPSDQPNQLPSITPRSRPAQAILEGAKDFVIKDSILTNVQGDVIMFRFDIDGSPTEEFKTLFSQHMAGLVTVNDLDKIATTMKEHGLSQAIRDLPRSKAAYDDYTSSKRRRAACFKNTRQALLKEIALHVTSVDGPRAYLLFGIAGVGKSTVAHTVAERLDNLRLLGASFFFSRDEADRRTAEKFFSSIAFQLCAYNKQFADAIGAVLIKERGAAATSKNPQEQLAILIIEPLRAIVRSRSLPTVIVVDALDECDVDDGPIILMALSRLVQDLPSFRVVLTARPQPHLQYLLHNLGAHQVFRMEDIEKKVVEGDIRLYLEYSLSRDQVDTRLPMLRRKWAANDEEIVSLVRASGQLFIIASTAVLFILNTAARNPEARMKLLQDEFAQNRTPFNALTDFYTIILRNAVPIDCERDIVERYQAVVGTLALIQDLLPIRALANLIGVQEVDMYSVVDNLQSVISLGSNDVPLVYHKSFPDFITDDQRCQDANLLIVPKTHHTRLATCCLLTMNAHLKRNILGLGDPVLYFDNKTALKEAQLSEDNVQQAIPSELLYATIHWANHVEQADLKDYQLTIELETFAEEHLLHWLEALSWTDKLDTAYIPLGIVLKLQTLNSDIRQIFSDALRLVSRDYGKIEEFALYPYHSALAFAPTESLLYKKYKHAILVCQVEGGPTQWDILIAEKQHGKPVYHVAFERDSSRFASWAYDNVKLWDATSGTPIRTFDGTEIALAADFSVLAVPQDGLITMYSVSSSAPIASFNHSAIVVKMAVSFDGSRLAAGLMNGTVRLWDVSKGVSIADLDAFDGRQLAYSPSGYMFAFTASRSFGLWNGADAVTRLEHEREEPVKFAFSGDGTRLATLAKKNDECELRLWNSKNGNLLAAARDVGEKLVISADGSIVATGGRWKDVRLWSGGSLVLVDSLPLEADCNLSFSGDMLAVASDRITTLYDVKNRTVIAKFQIRDPTSLALSPDGTRLSAGNLDGAVHLLDVPSIKLSCPTPEQHQSPVSALALSSDCLRLASGRLDGTIELWDTDDMGWAIVCHKVDPQWVVTLAFSPDGNQVASGSTDERVRVWDGKNGPLIGILDHSFFPIPTSLAFSSNLLAAATGDDITLWDRASLALIRTVKQGSNLLSFSLDGSVLASSRWRKSRSKITVWDTQKHIAIATFTVDENFIKLLPSPDGSTLASQRGGAGFNFFDIVNQKVINHLENKDLLSWVPHMNRIPISWKHDHLIGRFSAHHDCVPVLRIPQNFLALKFASQSSTFALGCDDGRILLIRPSASY